jgi:hypothetical protein
MLLRVVQFLLGAVLAGGGGYLAWTYRADAAHVFPPGVSGLPVLLLAGLLGLTSGLVFLVSAVHPRPNQRRLAAEKAERDDAALGQADAYYSQRARAADRDWRSGDIAPLAPPAPPPEPPKPVPAAAAPAPQPAPQPAAPVTPSVVVPSPSAPDPAPLDEPTKPRGQRSLSMPPPAPKSAPAPEPIVAKPAAPKPAPVEPAPKPAPVPAPEPIVAKPAASTAAPPPSPFPAQVTLTPLPRAAEPPPAPAPQAAVATHAPVVAADDPHAEIRAAINAGRLDEADRMLAATRDSATGLDLARLTALAGDHAAVSGRQSHAKWLWRLALKRFGELDAMNSPAAKAVAESLRQAG